MRACIICLFVVIGSLSASAQINIVQSSDIIDLVNQDKATNKAITKISGWSVQLLASNERSKVTDLKVLFLNTYSNIKVDWDYQAPYYKLKAGAFLTKREATRLLFQIRDNFPDAYVVRNNNIAPIDLL
ncbi:MAG: hypothetical protein ACPG19_00180 [Saprospiraceae bacterium]